MPYTAYSVDKDDLVFVQQADAEGRFKCIDCNGAVSYVRSHRRNNPSGGQYTVNAHFRHNNCDHGTINAPADSSGGGGGSGGGGESEIHKRRKWAAMQEALNRFEASDYDTERQIGSKRADAVVVFDEPHEVYGKGLVIEYQHKNEGKDIEATERHFAEAEYTTVWLWEDQYDFTSSVPEIDFFGGRVYTPWPDAVPQQSNWRGLGHDSKKRQEWASAYDEGLTKAEVKAKIPSEYFDEQSRSIWRQQDWTDLFSPSDEPKYRLQAVIPVIDAGSLPQPALMKRWWLPHPRKVWRTGSWEERFRGTATIPTTDPKTTTKAGIPFGKWVAEDNNSLYRDHLKQANERGLAKANRFQTLECQNCGNGFSVRKGPAEGQTSWSRRCRECGEWTVLYDSSKGY